MPTPGEHKTVQARILKYAQEIGWSFVPRTESDKRRWFDASAITGAEKTRSASLFFDNLFYQKVCEFYPLYKEPRGALAGKLQQLHADIYGNREFLTYLRNASGNFLEPVKP